MPKPSAKRLPDPRYFSILELAAYSGLGVRFLRDALKDPLHPLPHFRPNRKTVLIRRDEYDEWLEHYRADDGGEINRVVEEVMRGL